jgi:hypothetical protein
MYFLTQIYIYTLVNFFYQFVFAVNKIFAFITGCGKLSSEVDGLLGGRLLRTSRKRCSAAC